MVAKKLDKQRIAQELLTHGAKMKIDQTSIITLPTSEDTPPIVIVSVPKKSCKSAVKRNRIRRQCKGMIQYLTKNREVIKANWMFICKTDQLSPNDLANLRSLILSQYAQKNQ